MNEIARPTPLTDDPAWRPGDVVIDARGAIRVRSDHPHWVWGYPDEGEPGQIPEGSLAEDEVQRPLTLLVRDGKPLTTIVVKQSDG